MATTSTMPAHDNTDSSSVKAARYVLGEPAHSGIGGRDDDGLPEAARAARQDTLSIGAADSSSSVTGRSVFARAGPIMAGLSMQPPHRRRSTRITIARST